MKNILLSAVLFLFSFASYGTTADSVVRVRIHSTVLNQKRGLFIHFPRNYDPAKKYPVMYVLDGGAQDRHISHKFDSLFLLGQAPAVIVVGIPNMSSENRQSQLAPPYMQIDQDNAKSPGGKGDDFLLFIETEVIPYMEKTHAVSAVRLLAGHSRGGLLVLHSLLVKPDLFQARFCFSAPVWRQDQLMVNKTRDFLAANPALKTFLYMSVGGDETANMKSGHEGMKQALTAKAPAGLVWYVDDIPGAVHQDITQGSAGIGIFHWSKWAAGGTF